MSDPPACPAEIGSALDDLVRRAAHAMDPAHAFSAHGDAQVSTPAQCRADDLARLRAVEALRADLETTADMIARRPPPPGRRRCPPPPSAAPRPGPARAPSSGCARTWKPPPT